jgi:Arylsulfotransferase (ASST)
MPSSRHQARRWVTVAGLAALGAAAATAPSVAATSSHRQAASTPTAPPPVTSLVHGIGDREGKYFITPTGDTSTYANGPEIVDGNGKVLWFHAVPAADTAADFKEQTYNGKPVLTWWQGTGLGGVSDGTDVIDNVKGQQIATVTAGNGLTTDGHEFFITPQNTALVLSYYVTTADLTSIGGAPDQSVIDGVVQEVNIKTGKVLLSWNGADHVPYSASEQPLPASTSTPWDWFHVNAVHLDTDGSLLIDARNTWAAYDVNRTSGAVKWVLGGKDSSFTEHAAPGQQLDQHTHVATLVKSANQPDHLSAPSQGNGQTLRDGNVVVGWGALPYFSEFSPSGALLDNLEFPTGVNTYRAYRFPWPARR